MVMKDALREACQIAGGQKSLADRIGVTQSMVWYWLERSKRGLPAERVEDVERVTGVARHKLRPDLYSPPQQTAGETA